MTPLSHEILEKYQIRKSYKQKTAFIQLLQKHFPQLTIDESRFPKCRNLIIGNPETAKLILSAHYDTCARSPFPNFIAPKRPLLSVLHALLTVLPILFAAFLLIVLLQPLGLGFWTSYQIAFGCYLLYMLLLLFGPANKHTANDNTSGVIVLCELLQALDDAQLDQLAFVFFDQEETGLIGSSHFRSKYKKAIKNKLLINFDCVSDGSYILVAASKKARTQYDTLLQSCFTSGSEISTLYTPSEKAFYPSDQIGFPSSVAIAALNYHRFFGHYASRIHTSKDTVFEEKNIDFLCHCTQKLIRTLHKKA